MAAAHKNARVDVLATQTTLYTCPVATQAIIHSLFIANTNATTDRTVTIEVYDDSGAVHTVIGKNIPVPAEDTFVVPGKITLEASDVLKVTADSAGDLEANANLVEIS